MSRTAGERLARALVAPIAAFDCIASVETDSRPWASVTFTGEQHSLAIRLSGPDAGAAADALLDGIEEREFALPGHIVISIAAAGRAQTDSAIGVKLEALTIEAD